MDSSVISKLMKKYREVGGIVYLACPYASNDPDVEEARFRMINLIAGRLMSVGIKVFSPISHGHPINVSGEFSRDFDWLSFDELILKICSLAVVIKFYGWRFSEGVAHEVNCAAREDTDVIYVEPSALGIDEADFISEEKVLNGIEMDWKKV